MNFEKVNHGMRVEQKLHIKRHPRSLKSKCMQTLATSLKLIKTPSKSSTIKILITNRFSKKYKCQHLFHWKPKNYQRMWATWQSSHQVLCMHHHLIFHLIQSWIKYSSISHLSKSGHYKFCPYLWIKLMDLALFLQWDRLQCLLRTLSTLPNEK